MADGVASAPAIVSRLNEDGSTSVELVLDGKAVSGLAVIPFTLRIGAARVRMDGIGGVWTAEEHRRQGYSRRVLEVTVARMQSGDAALSMLYGIRDFYPKFGYATAGPEHLLFLTHLTEAPLPAGWQVRPLAADDLPTVHRLYDAHLNRPQICGAAERAPEGKAWKRLAAVPAGEGEDECRVLLSPSGELAAYLWRARGLWPVTKREREHPDALVLGEVVARDSPAAHAALAAARAWALEAGQGRPEPLKQVFLAQPPTGPVATAAMHHDARFQQQFHACGGSMARVLHAGRLLEALRPEFARRLQATRCSFTGALRLVTDAGEARLVLDGAEVRLESSPAPARSGPQVGPSEQVVQLPQETLGRLALGAFPPEDLLADLEPRLDEETLSLLATLFPLRHPHMYLPDRF